MEMVCLFWTKSEHLNTATDVKDQNIFLKFKKYGFNKLIDLRT